MVVLVSEPIVVEVRRNDSSRRGTASTRSQCAAARSSRRRRPGLVCFMRSSSKPFQALPLVRARDDLAEDEIAIACASHHDTANQVEAARKLLAHAEATEDDLELGLEEGRPPQKIHHNCSGKHAGMLALCRARGWPTGATACPTIRFSRRAATRIVEATGLEDFDTAADGCGVVTFAMPLERMAHAYSRLESLPGGDRIAAAMRARPGPRRRPRRRRLPPHARRARLAREGRRGRPALRGRPRRPRRCAEVRGRRVAPARARLSRRSSAGSASRRGPRRSAGLNSRGEPVGAIVTSVVGQFDSEVVRGDNP